jgi:hypothetical protein
MKWYRSGTRLTPGQTEEGFSLIVRHGRQNQFIATPNLPVDPEITGDLLCTSPLGRRQNQICGYCHFDR